jgi:hypothetical protein
MVISLSLILPVLNFGLLDRFLGTYRCFWVWRVHFLIFLFRVIRLFLRLLDTFTYEVCDHLKSFCLVSLSTS